MARIKVGSAKQKGRELQKWVCKKISKAIGLPWGYEDDKLIQPRLMGQSGTDVVLRGEALDRFPFSVECKSKEAWKLPSAIMQAKANQLKGTEWLLVLKKKAKPNKAIVVLDAEFFFEEILPSWRR